MDGVIVSTTDLHQPALGREFASYPAQLVLSHLQIEQR